MSLSVVNAKTYVARIIGGGGSSQESLDMAGEAMLRAYQDWQNKRNWTFLLRDTSLPTNVAGVTATSGQTVVNAPSSGLFDFVNINQTVTITSATATLPANTTILSYTRNSDGTIATITLSNAFGGTTDSAATLTFSANIPIVVGVNEYNVPSDFYKPFSTLTTVNKITLAFRDQRWWDRTVVDQTISGLITEYTVYSPISELTQNFGTKRLKFDRFSDKADTLLLRYYRKFNPNLANVDMPDEFLYQFLDYARNVLLATKRAQDDPQGYAENTEKAAESAAENDDSRTDDDDIETCMKSQWETGDWNRPLWANGPFDPFRY